jgi:NAD(P)-dependent dehydrogenase (short-subunit alcohol dehydrogenase family)
MNKALRCILGHKTNTFNQFAFKQFSKRTIDPWGGKEVVKKHPPPNPNRLKGKFAIITGGSNGVGKCTTELFVQSGIEGITIADWDAKKGKELAEKINEDTKSHVAKFFQVDVSNDKQVSRLFIEHMQTFGKLNILFNNAGILMNGDDGPCNTDLETYEKTMDVNVKGVFLCHKYGIPEILKSGGGSIINVASIVALSGSAAAQVVYTASKGAVLAMSREISVIYARDNIRVNTICPGPLSTELLQNLFNTEEKLDRRLVHIPIGRFGHPQEIAQTVAFLGSDESSLMTGAQLVIDGGITSAYVTPTKI